MPTPQFIWPDWPLSATVRACSTTRIGGVSEAPFKGFNLSARSGDAPASVHQNRALLRESLDLPAEPSWLWQVHGTRVVDAAVAKSTNEHADAAWTDRPGVVCAVLSADCLPVLLAERSGRCVAAVHAGWRGLLSGVLEATVAALSADPARLCAWLGPAIRSGVFAVGADVRDAFCAQDSTHGEYFQTTQKPGRWLADLAGLARERLRAVGVVAHYGSEHCTYSDEARFFSYRRDGARSGRMASLIWLVG